MSFNINQSFLNLKMSQWRCNSHNFGSDTKVLGSEEKKGVEIYKIIIFQ